MEVTPVSPPPSKAPSPLKLKGETL